MENQYRYRAVPPGFSRMLSFAFFFAIALGVGNLVVATPVLIVLEVVLGALVAGEGTESLRLVGAAGVIGFVILEIAVVMAALWICMKWGKFSGTTLKFVRPNLVDVAAGGKG